MVRKKQPTGIRTRHARTCPASDGGRCRCHPSYEAWVYSKRDGTKIRRTFRSLAEAKGWRADATTAVRKNVLKPPTRVTLTEAAEAFLTGVRNGSIRARKGQRYKPSTIRSYAQTLRDYTLPELGALRLSEVRRNDVQDLADRLVAQGLDPSTVHNALMPLRAIYRRAVKRGDVAVNPTTDVELPAVEGTRDRIADPAEAEQLLAVLPEPDRAIYATAMYAGLRLGELRALDCEHIDLERNVIRVQRSWDAIEGVIEPKSKAGRRTVPIPKALRVYLLRHRVLTGRRTGLVFGRTPTAAFDTGGIWRRSRAAWAGAGLRPLTLQEGRHTFASLMIAAGVNAKALTTYMGHASIKTTFDRYGHLMPGNETEAAGLLDDYLDRATGASTGASSGP